MRSSELLDRVYAFAAQKSPLLTGLVIYTPLGAALAWRAREQINPDAVSYLLNARYILEGRFELSVSGYWSPLISWLVVPFLSLGLEPLHAARVVLFLAGAGFLLATRALMKRLVVLQPIWQHLSMAVFAVNSAWFSARLITPDLLLAALLGFYLVAVVPHGDGLTPRRALYAGLLGGLAYLGKAYALPFFIVHFPVTVLVHWWRVRRRAETDAAPHLESGGGVKFLFALAAGFLGVVLVAGPWVCVLSNRYGRFTWSTSASLVRAVYGPSTDGTWPMARPGFLPPAPGRKLLSETPELVELPVWSPLGDACGRRHQLLLIRRNLGAMRGGFDRFGLIRSIWLLSPAFLWFLRRRREEFMRILWSFLTMTVHVGGYLLILVEERYLWPVYFPVGTLVLLRVASGAVDRIGAAGTRARWLRVPFAVFVFALLAATPARGAMRILLRGYTSAYRVAGEILRQTPPPGPLASSDVLPGRALAFHGDLVYLGIPTKASGTEEELAAELWQHGIRFYVCKKAPGDAASDLAGFGYRLIAQIPSEDVLGEMRLDVYAADPGHLPPPR